MTTFTNLYIKDSINVKKNITANGKMVGVFVSKTNPNPYLYLMADGSFNSGSGGLGQAGFYNYQVKLSSDYGNIQLGYFSYNNTLQYNSTAIYINCNTSDALDISLTISRLQDGNEIYIQNVSNSNIYQIFRVTAVPSQISKYVYMIPVVLYNSSVDENGSKSLFTDDTYLALNLQYVNMVQINASLANLAAKVSALEQKIK